MSAATKPPGPPDPPITAGAQGWPSREKLNAMVATLGVFEWCEANGLLEEWSTELRRARDAFMFAHGPTAERWREQTGEEPSWSQYAYLIRDNERLREENQRLTAGLREATDSASSEEAMASEAAARERSATVGCSYPSVRGLKRSLFQGTCSCGWEGPRRRDGVRAREDVDDHHLVLAPAAATPGVIRTGTRVRVTEEGKSYLRGAFLGVGPDSRDGSLLLFVQIGHGCSAFPLATTGVEPEEPHTDE